MESKSKQSESTEATHLTVENTETPRDGANSVSSMLVSLRQ